MDLKKIYYTIYSLFTEKKSVLITLLVLSVITRFYALPSTFLFQGDQGRDALEMYSLIFDKHPIVLGPTTSLGHYYLGPFFYYFITPSLLLSKFNPVGPALFQAVLSVCTVLLMYLFSRKVVSPISSSIAGFVFALSPALITYGRFSWNPNSTTLFAILFIWSFYNFLNTQKKKWFIWSMICLTLLWQLHYVLLVLGIAGLFLTVVWMRQRFPIKTHLFSALLLFPFFVVSLLPLFASFIKSYAQNSSGESLILISGSTVFQFGQIFLKNITTLFATQWWNPLSLVTITLIIVGFGSICFQSRQIKKWWKNPQYSHFFWFMIATTVLFALLGLSIIRGSVETHYLLGFYPFFILLLGKGFDVLFQGNSVKTVSLFFLIIILLFIHFSTHLDVFKQKGISADTIQRVTQFIAKHSNNEPFNFALLSHQNERKSYEYFFTLQHAEEENKTVTHRIYVVCESEDCPISGNPDWQIALFESTYPDQVMYSEISMPNMSFPKIFTAKVP